MSELLTSPQLHNIFMIFQWKKTRSNTLYCVIKLLVKTLFFYIKLYINIMMPNWTVKARTIREITNEQPTAFTLHDSRLVPAKLLTTIFVMVRNDRARSTISFLIGRWVGDKCRNNYFSYKLSGLLCIVIWFHVMTLVITWLQLDALCCGCVAGPSIMVSVPDILLATAFRPSLKKILSYCHMGSVNFILNWLLWFS